MNKVNYQAMMEQTIKQITAISDREPPKLLLHSCCAPCSSYVLEYLSEYFSITVLYYNPNIFPEAEYTYRIEEQKRLIEELNEGEIINKINFFYIDYKPERFYETVKGYEQDKEGGERCFRCYELRLRETAEYAQAGKYDYFTTTLSISPLKNADKLNKIGRKLSEETGIEYLYSDFKKRNGYKRSVELSAEHKLYRQDYCGCIYSKRDRDLD